MAVILLLILLYTYCLGIVHCLQGYYISELPSVSLVDRPSIINTYSIRSNHGIWNTPRKKKLTNPPPKRHYLLFLVHDLPPFGRTYGPSHVRGSESSESLAPVFACLGIAKTCGQRVIARLRWWPLLLIALQTCNPPRVLRLQIR